MQQQIIEKIWHYQELFLPLQPQIDNGTLADRLGNGLQNRVGQFDSARYLTKKRNSSERGVLFLFISYESKSERRRELSDDRTIPIGMLQRHTQRGTKVSRKRPLCHVKTHITVVAATKSVKSDKPQ